MPNIFYKDSPKIPLSGNSEKKLAPATIEFAAKT